MWSFSLLLVVLGAVGISSNESVCPTDEEIYPCECQESSRVTVKCTGNMTVDQITDALQSLKNKAIDKLELELLHLDTLPSTLFQDTDTRIRAVEISFSHIGGFSDGDRPFLGLENSLKKLTIYSSTIEEAFKLGHLQSLRDLSIRNSGVPEINGDLFEEGIPSLRNIVILSSIPRKIGNDFFAKLTNLETLDIRHQSLEKLERSLLPNPAPALERLTFYRTLTSDIDEDFFTNMPALKTVAVQRNPIYTINESVFKPIWEQLDVVSFSENPIVCDYRLNWLLPVTTKPHLYATCQSPEELRYRKVGDLPEGKTEYDP